MESLKTHFSKIAAELKKMGETKKVSPKIGKLILKLFAILWGMFKVFFADLYSSIFGQLNKVLPIPKISTPSIRPEG
jgi:hypothetical protein